MIRIRTMTTATTTKMWIKPPIVYDVTMPRSQRTRRMTAIVASMLTSTASYQLGATLVCAVVNSLFPGPAGILRE